MNIEPPEQWLCQLASVDFDWVYDRYGHSRVSDDGLVDGSQSAQLWQVQTLRDPIAVINGVKLFTTSTRLLSICQAANPHECQVPVYDYICTE
jgi:hypothetical protein